MWISAQETGVKVVANYTAQSATLAGTSYSSGATQTVLSATNASFSLVLKAENNDTASYNFTFKTITDGAKVSGATVSSGSTQLGTGTPNTSDVIDIEIDYADASGNVYTNPTLQFTLPTNHTKLHAMDNHYLHLVYQQLILVLRFQHQLILVIVQLVQLQL